MSNLSPWIDGFTKTVRQNLPLIKGAVSQGIGASATYNMLKAGGTAGRKTDFLRMYRDIKAASRDVNTYLDQTDPTARPNPDLIPPSLGRQERAYSYVVDYKAKSAITGFNFTETVTISSSSILNVEQVMDLALEAANPYDYVDEVYQDSIQIKDIHYSDNPIFQI